MVTDNALASLETALTQSNEHSRACANPFCNTPMGAISPQGKHGRYCCARCRLDGYVLRRAEAMMNEVGVIEFFDRISS